MSQSKVSGIGRRSQVKDINLHMSQSKVSGIGRRSH
jgi:hypothetical protein